MTLFRKEEPDLSEKVCFPKRCALSFGKAVAGRDFRVFITTQPRRIGAFSLARYDDTVKNHLQGDDNLLGRGNTHWSIFGPLLAKVVRYCGRELSSLKYTLYPHTLLSYHTNFTQPLLCDAHAPP